MSRSIRFDVPYPMSWALFKGSAMELRPEQSKRRDSLTSVDGPVLGNIPPLNA